jgi:flavin-dependent dehydrogenase
VNIPAMPFFASPARGRVVSPVDASAHPWQVVIIGGGPAAAACGLAATAGGLSVLIVERSRMPRSKLCGCCLSPRGQRELRNVGLESFAAQCGIPLEHVRLVTPGGQTRLPFCGSRSLSRDLLDSTLLGHAVDRGCFLLPETAVLGLSCERDRAELTCRTGPETTGHDRILDARLPHGTTVTLSTECVVLATGLAESVRLHATAAETGEPRRAARSARIGLGATLPPEAATLAAGELIMAVEPHGYCGVVLLEDGRVDIAAAVDADAVSHTAPSDLLASLLARTELGPLPLDSARIRGTPPLSHRRRLSEGRMLRVGDAAGYVEPFTGEGIGWALTSGRLAGAALASSLTGGTFDHAAAADIYERGYAAELAGSFRRCQLVARAVRSPTCMRAALGAVRIAPWAAGALVRLATGSR